MILCEHCGGREKMNKEFLDAIEANPIIAAVKDEQGLQNCLGREELTAITTITIGANRSSSRSPTLYPFWATIRTTKVLQNARSQTAA